MASLDIRLRRGGRAMNLGKTGSGKTHLARYLIAHYRAQFPKSPLFFFDTKGDEATAVYYDPQETVTVTAAQLSGAISKHEISVFIVRPTAEELTSIDPIDQALEVAYNVGDCLIYLDEAGQILYPGNRIGRGLANVLMRGRSRFVTTLASVQRPVNISRSYFTESEQFYIFNLTDLRDRKRVREFVPDDKVLDQPPQKYQFYYYDVNEDEVVLMKAAPQVETYKAPANKPAPEPEPEPRHKWV